MIQASIIVPGWPGRILVDLATQAPPRRGYAITGGRRDAISAAARRAMLAAGADARAVTALGVDTWLHGRAIIWIAQWRASIEVDIPGAPFGMTITQSTLGGWLVCSSAGRRVRVCPSLAAARAMFPGASASAPSCYG